jgi:hypothetical protein
MMRQELQDKLMVDFQFYTGYFGKGLSFECQSGWYDLLRELSDKLQSIININHFDLHVIQVKSKFGTLKFYVDSGTDAIFDLIEEYEHKSEEICEECGAKGSLVCYGHWYYTRCPKCAAKLRDHES